MDMLDVEITNSAHPGNPPTSTVSDFTVPAIERIDLTAPGGEIHNGFEPLPCIASHIDAASYDECGPLQDLSATGQEPWAAAQVDINTHVEDPGAPQFYLPPEIEPEYSGYGMSGNANSDLAVSTSIVGETSEPAGQLYNDLGYGPDGDNDDDDTEMPPYGEAFVAPGLTHRERHLDPMFQGLKGEVPVYDGELTVQLKPASKAVYDGAL